MHEKAIIDTETGGGFQFRISEASGKEHVSHQMLRLRKIFEYMEVSQMICLKMFMFIKTEIELIYIYFYKSISLKINEKGNDATKYIYKKLNTLVVNN